MDTFNPFPSQEFLPRAAHVIQGSIKLHTEAAEGEGDPGDTAGEWRQRTGGFSWKQRWRKLRRGHGVGRMRARRGRHGTDGDERGAAAGSAALGGKGKLQRKHCGGTRRRV